MKIETYVINLKSSPERMAYISGQMDLLGMTYNRIDAVFGDLLEEPIEGYDESKFQRLFGKKTNKRAIGCYFSHIQAFRKFLETDSDYALVLEDDATLPQNLNELIQASLRYSAHWDLLRMSSFREGTFLVIGQLTPKHQIAYNTGIVKNTAAYLINRKAAALCIEKMLPMFLPYDIALDREWLYGFKAACVTPFPVVQRKEIESQIPRGSKIKKYRALAKAYNIYTRITRKRARLRYFKRLQAKSETDIRKSTGNEQ